MVRSLLDEARRAPLDDAGRRALKEIHERSIHELEEILSPDLRQELEEVTLPFSSDTPSESELRIAQAQLVGWLEGLFHGIQATLFTQQMQAQRQFEEMRGGRNPLELGQGVPARHATVGNLPARTSRPRDVCTRAVTEPELGAIVVAVASRGAATRLARRRRARRRARAAARDAAARVRGRGAHAEGRAGRRVARATASCCTPATARSRSPSSRPTTSATS